MSDTPKPLLQTIAEALTHPGAIWVVASNAIPVAGVLLWGWSAFPLLVFYWIENVVVGVFNFVKILVAGFTKSGEGQVWALPLALFFAVHYGLFCLVHGMFMIGILTIGDLVANGTEPVEHAFNLGERVLGALQTDRDLLVSVVGMVLVQTGAFLAVWLGLGKFRDASPMLQVFEPYGRVVVMHLTIFVAAIPVVLLGQPQFAVLVLALMKSGLELGLPHFRTLPEAGSQSKEGLI